MSEGTAEIKEGTEVFIDDIGNTGLLPDEPQPDPKADSEPKADEGEGSEGSEGEDPKADEGEPKDDAKGDDPLKPGDIEYTKKVRKNIDKLVRERGEAQRDAEYWKAKALEASTPKPKEDAPKEQDSSVGVNEPKEEDFETNAAYIKALGTWQYNQDKIADQAAAEEERQRTETLTLVQKFNERVEASKIREKVLDFDELVETNVYSPTMRQLVLESEVGPQLAVYLAKNTETSQAIAKMSPVGAAREIGKLEVTLSQKPIKKSVTQAVDPISPLNGNDAPKIRIHDGMSQAEYEKARGFGR